MGSPGTSARPILDRDAIVSWFLETRRRSRRLFDLLSADAYYSQPIALRHPIVFYEGHLAAFAVNTLLKKALGGRPLDPRLDVLFARGIDPEDHVDASRRAIDLWPPRSDVREYVDAADAALLDALRTRDLERPGHPLLDRGEAVFSIIEHEAMHQETLLYIWHRLPFGQKHSPDVTPVLSGRFQRPGTVEVSPGTVTLGAGRDEIPFGWDNEFPRQLARVAAFDIDVFNVTNEQFLEFVNAGGYRDRRLWSDEAWQWIQDERKSHPLFWEPNQDFRSPIPDPRSPDGWMWRGMFELIPLPLEWPVYVSQAEATAFATWRGRRLPTEAEFHRAAYGTPSGEERDQPWGASPAEASRGNFDFTHWDPVPVGSYARGCSAWGVHDLVGNGWEWTSTIFDGFPGFSAMASYPEYSADFFDGRHYVMKGASPATARELVRRSFRNWFRPQYPYVYATFRTARSLGSPS